VLPDDSDRTIMIYCQVPVNMLHTHCMQDRWFNSSFSFISLWLFEWSYLFQQIKVTFAHNSSTQSDGRTSMVWYL